ncbi:MAG: endonuclease/exonuclease/phosphatase family protein [Planctomycetota bacterium]|jgi:endonuclease/exonuclease/phosphatase family metal-dependent hydrolase
MILRSGRREYDIITSTVLTLTIFVLVGCCPQSPATLSLLTYNIHHGRGLDGVVDLERIAKVIKETRPDLVALQEVDRFVERSGRVDQPRLLGDLTGMEAVFGKNLDLEDGEYGNAVLSRLPIEYYNNHHLPRSPDNEQRGLLEVHTRLGKRRIIFFSTHFDHKAEEKGRLAQLAATKDLMTGYCEHVVILAGDLNASDDSKVLENAQVFLSDTFRPEAGESFTFRADKPRWRIDYILYKPMPFVRCIEYEVIAEPVASDHCPVWAVISIE